MSELTTPTANATTPAATDSQLAQKVDSLAQTVMTVLENQQALADAIGKMQSKDEAPKAAEPTPAAVTAPVAAAGTLNLETPQGGSLDASAAIAAAPVVASTEGNATIAAAVAAATQETPPVAAGFTASIPSKAIAELAKPDRTATAPNLVLGA
jgi:hypothetical protein